jgi:hypothetical protein
MGSARASLVVFGALAKKFSRLLRLPDQKLARFRLAAHIFDMLPDEGSTPEQIAMYRQMTSERRLSLAEQL